MFIYLFSHIFSYIARQITRPMMNTRICFIFIYFPLPYAFCTFKIKKYIYSLALLSGAWNYSSVPSGGHGVCHEEYPRYALGCPDKAAALCREVPEHVGFGWLVPNYLCLD